MKQADAAAIASRHPGIELMRRAGRAVADRCRKMVSPGARIVDLRRSGPERRRRLRRGARSSPSGAIGVTLGLLGSGTRLTGDAAEAARGLAGRRHARSRMASFPGGRPHHRRAVRRRPRPRDLDGAARQVVERINASGTAGARGRPAVRESTARPGEVRGIAVKAAAHRDLRGPQARPSAAARDAAFAGRSRSPISGSGRTILEAGGGQTFRQRPGALAACFPAARALASHKYDRGHTLVASGGATRTGAARLAARAALRIGAGLVTVASPAGGARRQRRPADGHHAARLRRSRGAARILEDKRFNALVLGPGARRPRGDPRHGRGRRPGPAQPRARRGCADVLRGLASELHGAFRQAPTVLTPHDGEFSRLFKGHAGYS